MKDNKKCILIIFIFSILIMLAVINTGYIKGHDTDFHVANISAIADKLSWNNLLVQQPLKYIANNFGYGTRFFYPPIPHLLAAYITKALTIFNINNIILGMRITQWITFLASGITFFYLALKIFKNKKISVVSSLFYMTAPYHLSEIFIRDAFSEMFIPIAIPLIILGLLYLLEEKYTKFLMCFIIGYTIAIYSHMAMSIYFTLMIVATFFIVYFKKIFTKKNILYLVFASVLILLLTASFWMPMLEIKLNGSYGIFVPYLLTGKGDLRYSTISILELIDYTKPHTYDYIRFHLPLFVTIMITASIFLIFKNKLWKEKIWIFLLAFTILAIVMVTPLFPWYYTPSILQTLQFPWRLALYIAFGGILISGIILKQIENKKYFNIACGILICLTLFSSYYYTYHLNKDTIDINNIDYSYGIGNQAEYMPEKTLNDMEYYNNRTNDITILSGSGNIKITLDDVPNLNFEVKQANNMVIELPRLYYMGYSLKIDGQEIDLTESSNGYLQATIKQDGIYTLNYKKTTIMKIANILSLITFITLLATISIHKIRKKRNS